mmetsp:Transcript_17597/g.41753  ORF Transcript_17597/g.41753 Transcript_17597/m.41753 type:complete len:120 (+) Transcript_17597:2051-2410(+)
MLRLRPPSLDTLPLRLRLRPATGMLLPPRLPSRLPENADRLLRRLRLPSLPPRSSSSKPMSAGIDLAPSVTNGLSRAGLSTRSVGAAFDPSHSSTGEGERSVMAGSGRAAADKTHLLLL